MDRKKYDKQLLKWVKNHYWDSLEKDKDLIVRHMRTFIGDINYQPSDIEILEVYEDWKSEIKKDFLIINDATIWLEAFKSGMRFNHQ